MINIRKHLKQTAQKVTHSILSLTLVAGGLGGSLPFLSTQTANALGSSDAVYSSLPASIANASFVSEAFQATSTSEFGDYVHLGGSNRVLNNVTVTMVDWAKHSSYPSYGNATSWTLPMTLNVYDNQFDANGTPTHKIATVTQDQSILWRPESDNTCGDTSNGKGWKIDSTCYDNSGIASNANFDLSSLNVTLPDDIVVSVAFNTQTHGYSPTHVAGPYDGLNVAIPTGQSTTVGNDVSNDMVLANSTWTGGYSGVTSTDGGPTGIFRKSTTWAPYGTVAMQVTATAPAPPAAPTGVSFVKDATTIASGSTINYKTGVALKWNTVAGANRYRVIVHHPSGPDSNWEPSTSDTWNPATLTFQLNNADYTDHNDRKGYFGERGEGTYTYTLQARDKNTLLWSDATIPVVLTYDKTLPTASFTTTPPQAVNGTFHVEGVASDNTGLKSVFFDIRDGGTLVGQCKNPITLVYNSDKTSATIKCDMNTANLVNGHTYTLRIHAGDNAGYGNVNADSQVSFVFDTTGPTATIKSDSSYTVGSGPYQKISYSLFDAHQIDKVVLNGVTKDLSNNNYSDLNYVKPGIFGAVEGANSLEVYDVAGNKTTIAFTLDTHAPTGSFTYSNNNGAQVTADDVIVTLTTNESIDTPSGWTKVNDTHFTKTYDDNGKFSVVATDLAGNSSTLKYEVKRIDHIAPTIDNVIEGTSYTGSVDYTVTEQSLSKILVDGVSVAFSKVSGWTVTSDPITALGNHTIQAIDKAGNSTTVNFTIVSPITIGNEDDSDSNNTDTPTDGGGSQRSLRGSIQPAGAGGNVQNAAVTTGTVLGDSTTTPSNGDDKGEVKGDSTTDPSTVVVNDAASTSKDFLGLGWWWLAVIAAIALAVYLIFGKRRKQADEK